MSTSHVDVASVLQRLLIASELALCLRNPGDDALVLLEEVTAWRNKPTDRDRLVHDYTVMLANAVCEAGVLRHDRKGDPYRRVIGALLPDVRTDFGKAIEQRNRPTA